MIYLNGAKLLSALVAMVALICIISVSGQPVIAQSAPQCAGINLQCPVAGGCRFTSDYDLQRIDPVTGKGVRPHRGVDISALTPTEITAAADGKVTFAGDANTAGIAVEIDHGGARYTRYFHLQTDSVVVKAGDTVTAGQKIAVSDTTGRTKQPHLHFEYALSGSTFNTRGRVDPKPCVGNNISGSITVRDDGSAADDAFTVSVDGISLGKTEIGATNTFAVNNLRSGQHTLTITCYVAPDNVGTLGVTLANGWTFSNGSTTLSDGSFSQGQTQSYTFTVPAT